MKEIKDNTNKCIYHALGLENDFTTQSNPQIQHNSFQIANDIFHRLRTENFTICVESKKKPWIVKAILKNKMELEQSGSLTLDYATKLQ